MKNLIVYILMLIMLAACMARPALPEPPESTSTKSPIVAPTTPRGIVTALPVSTVSIFNHRILIRNQTNYYRANPDGSEQELIYADKTGQIEMASLSPDATKFAYFLNNAIYMEDIKTTRTVTLTQEDIASAGGSRMLWSPDEAKLAVTCSIEGQPSAAICFVDTQNGKIAVLLNEKNTDSFCASNNIALSDWSNDGSTIVYTCSFVSAHRAKQAFSVYLYDLASGTSKKILDGTTQDTIWNIVNVSISPDKNDLLITGARQDYLEQVFLLDFSNKSLKQLTNDTTYNSSASVWQSDGKTFYLNKTSTAIPYPVSSFVMNMDGSVVSSLNIEGTILR